MLSSRLRRLTTVRAFSLFRSQSAAPPPPTPPSAARRRQQQEQESSQPLDFKLGESSSNNEQEIGKPIQTVQALQNAADDEYAVLAQQARAEREQSAASTSASTATASHFDPTDPVALEIQKRAEIARRRAAINDELRRAQEQETAEQLSIDAFLKRAPRQWARTFLLYALLFGIPCAVFYFKSRRMIGDLQFLLGVDPVKSESTQKSHDELVSHLTSVLMTLRSPRLCTVFDIPSLLIAFLAEPNAPALSSRRLFTAIINPDVHVRMLAQAVWVELFRVRPRLIAWPLVPDVDDVFAYDMTPVPPASSGPASENTIDAAEVFALYHSGDSVGMLINPHAAQFQRRAGEIKYVRSKFIESLNQNPQCIESLLANNIFSDNQSLSLVSLSQNADAPSELFELLCEERSFRSVLAARQSTALLSNRFTAFVQQCAADFVHNQAAIIAPHLKQTNNSVEVIPVASYSLSPAQAQSRARWGVILTRLLSDTQTSASLLQNNTLVTNLIALLEQEVKAGIVTSAPAPPSSEAATLSFQKGRPLSYEAAIAAASWESKPMASQNERVAAVHLPALALRIALDQSKNKSGTKSEPAISAATCALLSSIRYSSVEPLPPMDWCTARSHSPASPTQQRRVRLSDPGSPKFHDPSDDSRSFVASALSASTPSLDCPTAFLPSAAESLAGLTVTSFCGILFRLASFNFFTRYERVRSPLYSRFVAQTVEDKARMQAAATSTTAAIDWKVALKSPRVWTASVPGALFWYALYRLQQHAQDAAFFGGNSGAFSGADGSGTAGISLSGFDLSGIRWVLFPHVQFSSADPQSLQTEIERLKMTAATAAAFTAVGTYVFPRGVLASALYANLERRWGAEKQADSFRAQRKL